MNYKHTQIGYLIPTIFIFLVLLFVIILVQTEFNLSLVIIMVFILFILASFASLKVIIDKKYLQIKFGYGIYKKKFLLQNIVSAKTVKNHWYYGWGIRIWFWPRMQIYNISGFDAVEIKLKNSKVYRIGTDEPDKLEQAIIHSNK